MMSITNSVPSIFQTFSPLLLKSTNFNFRITHSSKTKKQTSKNNNYKGTFFYIFFIKTMEAKNKIKQNNNKVKDWKQETHLAEIFFLTGNGARKLVGGAVLM
jgi:hypothetical protein